MFTRTMFRRNDRKVSHPITRPSRLINLPPNDRRAKETANRRHMSWAAEHSTRALLLGGPDKGRFSVRLTGRGTPRSRDGLASGPGRAPPSGTNRCSARLSKANSLWKIQRTLLVPRFCLFSAPAFGSKQTPWSLATLLIPNNVSQTRIMN